jgi:ABC-2 type transport system ATP-binding protein
MASTIEVRDLRRTYGDVTAVGGISFEVAEGEIFGLVGPNGAGKTTTIECVEGLRRPTSGHVRVLGMDPAGERREVAERIGIQLQESALPARLRVEEALALFGSFYRRSVSTDDLLGLLALTEKRAAAFAKLSGGQKQRLFIALALVNRPELVFFDELTTGLDPQARRSMWDLVRQVRDRGCTVVLTTHYMEEAERLCDRVMIVDRGHIVALDTPEALIGTLGGDKRIVFGLPHEQDVASLTALSTVTRIERSNGRVIVYGHGDRFASSVVSALEDAGVGFTDLRTEQPNLEDVFLLSTGKEMRQ